MSAKEKRKLSTVVSILCVMFVALIVVYIKFINNKATVTNADILVARAKPANCIFVNFTKKTS